MTICRFAEIFDAVEMDSANVGFSTVALLRCVCSMARAGFCPQHWRCVSRESLRRLIQLMKIDKGKGVCVAGMDCLGGNAMEKKVAFP